ncbi:5-carboxymethyl-2-hydroxymuconate isomerase [Thozetella sp. PMI_491]|nr:5-carboxymethyl-2-hydroxymuconate isomerase [Thozetella sp. PMI_491]
MASWTHLIRFIAKEDRLIHLGQLVDTSGDVRISVLDGQEVKAYLINGTIFNGDVTNTIYTVERLLSPVSMEDCNYIRCLGLNYHDHAKVNPWSPVLAVPMTKKPNHCVGRRIPLPKVPVLFTKPRAALADPYPSTINIPKCAQDGTSDYEGELCAVIGKTGRDIAEEDALDYVLGYTASNDVSARQLQFLTAQWSFSKGLDGSCPLGKSLLRLREPGPLLVTPKVITDPQTLGIKTIYNGKVVQDGHTRDMIFSLRKQISYLSQGTTLEAGTLVLTGTPAGIGYLKEPRVVLRDGDDIRVEIENIGTLVNRVRYDGR